jgi:hypothetical protein
VELETDAYLSDSSEGGGEGMKTRTLRTNLERICFRIVETVLKVDDDRSAHGRFQ